MSDAVEQDTADQEVETDETPATPGNKVVPHLAEIEAYVAGEHVPVVQDAEEVNRQILAEIFTARTADEVLEVAEVVGADDVLDQPLEVTAVDWQRSDLENGPRFYAIVRGRKKEGGEKVAVTSGSQRCMAQLFKLDELKAWPQVIVFRQSEKQTKSGGYPMWIEKA